MKALFVHSARFKRTPEGAVYYGGQFSYRLWERYLRCFQDLSIVARITDIDHVSDNWSLSSGPNVQFFGVPDDHGNYLQQLRRATALRVLKGAVADSDAVIVRMSDIGWIAASEAVRQNKPWAVEVVGDAWNAYWNYGSVIGKLYAPIARWQARKWIKRARFARYVTKEYLQSRYPCSGVTCSISDVDISTVDEGVIKARECKLKAIGAEGTFSVKCGLIGDLSARYKGLHVALKALAKLQQRGLEVHLHNLGQVNHPRYQQEAKAMGVGALLHFDGIRPSGDPVYQWLDSMDFYIQPSLTEGLPRGLIEAMSRGLPCLASTCGGIPELLPAECLHRPGDDNKLAAHMGRLILDVPWRVGMSRLNFEAAKEYYSEYLDEKRNTFWARFVEYSRRGGCLGVNQ